MPFQWVGGRKHYLGCKTCVQLCAYSHSKLIEHITTAHILSSQTTPQPDALVKGGRGNGAGVWGELDVIDKLLVTSEASWGEGWESCQFTILTITSMELFVSKLNCSLFYGKLSKYIFFINLTFHFLACMCLAITLHDYPGTVQTNVTFISITKRKWNHTMESTILE